MLSALSPLDGRYSAATESLRRFFSEEALMRARVEVEVRYFLALAAEENVPELPAVPEKIAHKMLQLFEKFTEHDAAAIKVLEKTTRHDVKAVEYWLKQKLTKLGLKKHTEFVHFALTSEDVNNLAYGILIRDALKEVIIPSMSDVQKMIRSLGKSGQNISMLSLTHGQPATPTTLGKEFFVFFDRLDRQLGQLKSFKMQGKLGGAVGNFSAHRAAYPEVSWERFRKTFVSKLGLIPLVSTTQINPHDDLAELSHVLFRINTILLDLSRDMWMYISRGVFKQKVVAGEIGSSAMPHKVNPIDFENAEGNLGLSNAMFSHFAEKLPISRLQRDLSDSTVQRNIGVAFGYHLLAIKSLGTGFGRIAMDREAIKRELHTHPEVIAEAIQTVLRRRGVTGAYEQLKELTRGKHVSAKEFAAFIDDLALSKEEKVRLKGMLPA